jgi:DNA-binding transcriptional regulator YiaG
MLLQGQAEVWLSGSVASPGADTPHAAVRALLDSADPAYLRERAGIRATRIGVALGVSCGTVRGWELRRHVPSGRYAFRYARIVAGLARHLEIPEERP